MKTYLHKMANVISLGGFGTLHLIFFFLNVFAGIIGGSWLLFEGKWRLVVGGFIASFLMLNIWWIPWMPTLAINALVEKFHNSKFWWLTLVFISLLYQSFIYSLWVVAVFVSIFIVGLGCGPPSNLTMFIPRALFGYSVAVSPIAYMASHDPPDAIGAHSMRFLSQLEYLVLAGLYLGLLICGVDLRRVVGITLLFTPGIVLLLMVAEAIWLTLLARGLWQEELTEESGYE
jgi:hypothetical protein